nr:hypothetical protein [Pseudomonas oleovorans]
MSTKAGKQDIRNIEDVEVGIKNHWKTSPAGTTALQTQALRHLQTHSGG